MFSDNTQVCVCIVAARSVVVFPHIRSTKAFHRCGHGRGVQIPRDIPSDDTATCSSLTSTFRHLTLME